MPWTALRALEERLALPGFSQALAAALARGPEPERSAQRAASLIEAAARSDAGRLADAWRRDATRVVDALRALCAAAPFFTPFFARHPRWLGDLLEDRLEAPRGLAEYRERLTAALASATPAETAQVLRHFKYRELARITLRDCTERWVPEARVGETLAELSHLAEALLERALASAQEALAARVGPPRWRAAGDTVALGFCVLGLGKLGGEELNFSSDVDLIHVHESPAGGVESLRDGPGGMTPAEYFTRLAREFGRLVTESTPEGFLYRVDLDLRPEGGQGPLVIGADALAQYYEAWASSWEKTAFMKARPVAGDLALGWRVVRAAHPVIYRSSMDFEAVSSIRRMKQRIEEEKVRGQPEFDVKLGAGGIRDLEFVAQGLQLLHGGRIPQVRGRSAQAALQALAAAGVLEAERARTLLGAYRFLRRVENRLQMEAERQTHRVPRHADGRERLARSLGLEETDATARFDAALESHRQQVRSSFDEFLAHHGEERVLELFESRARSLLRLDSTRRMIEQLARQLARQIDASPHPERAMNNLHRFIEGVGSRSFYYGLLLDRPELVPRLAALFSASNYLSGFFATHPSLIEPVFSDPDVLLLTRAQLEANFEDVLGHLAQTGREPAELAMAALRLFHHRELLNVGLLDLAGKVTPEETEQALTEIAEVCLERALGFAREQLSRTRRAAPQVTSGEFLVVGMGKFGSRELTYGSDLDVIFLHDEPDGDEAALVEAQEHFVRLAQRLVSLLQTRTAEGLCFDVDARLRPSGGQGMLVTSLKGFERYHARSAQVWERQALLRARAVVGHAGLATRFEAARQEILRRPPPAGLAAEVHRIRLRVEAELGREAHGRRDFKTGRGGLFDVEDVVGTLQLLHGEAHPEILEPGPVARLLERLEALGLLSGEHAALLQAGWAFLQRLSSRLRIVENRSISDLDEERGDLDAVAVALGYATSTRTGGARLGLLQDYRRHTEAIRRVYLEVLGVEAP